MTYNHLTISELSFIQNFWNQGVKAYIVAKTLKRSAETIYRVFRFLDAGIRSLNTMKTIGLINLNPAVKSSYYLMMSLSTSRKKLV